ncbi:MAG: hypothetical protein Q8P67_05705, partial [archaeon]|nr:hypothetical protein [archaeon]
ALKCTSMPCSIKLLPQLLRALQRNQSLIVLEMDSSHLPSQQQHNIAALLHRNRSRPGLHDQLVAFGLLGLPRPIGPTIPIPSSSLITSSGTNLSAASSHPASELVIDGWVEI